MAPIIINEMSSFVSDFFVTYSTVKEVQIRSKFAGIFHRLLQFIILSSIIFYIILIQKGYQQFQSPYSSSIIKVKGVARVHIRKLNSHNDNIKETLWDASDYVVPPIERNAFFLVTRKRITYDQIQGTCPSALKDRIFCNSTHNTCKPDAPAPGAVGFLTGNCVPSQENPIINVCEINAWCPEEQTNSTEQNIYINDLLSTTIFIKTIVSFPLFNVKLRTIKQDTNFSCRFDNNIETKCPIFQIGYIIKKLHEQNPTINVKALYQHGGLIQIEQNWECDFDFSRERRECFPTYAFNVLQSGDDKLSPGINYKSVDKYHLNGIDYRTITKMYGLRFVLTVTGQGGRFNILHSFLAIGSGIGYMVIAELISEFILMRVHRRRQEFRRNKIKICSLKTRDRAYSTCPSERCLTMPDA